MEKKKFTGYGYTRQWFDFTIENPEKTAPVHTALFLWIVELNNRLGWKEKFSLPTNYSMQAIGIKNWRTYKKALNDLIEWGFIKIVTKSTNQYTANVVALVKNTVALPTVPLQKRQKQVSSTAHIDKQEETIKTIKTFFSEKTIFLFSSFLKEKKDVSEVRQNSLLTLLNSLSGGNDNYAQAIINKAIAGGYNSFVALTEEEKSILRINPMPILAGGETSPVRLIPPTEMELLKFFEDNGQGREDADKAYFHFNSKNWNDKDGNCFIKIWKEVATKNYFKNENKI